MDFERYTGLALRTANNLGPEGDLLHATLGITSEGGEIADTVKKHLAYGKPLNTQNLVEELGDLAWFMTLMMKTLGVSWGQVLSANIAKLETRYPDLTFDAEQATNRDKQLELEAIRYATGQ